MYKLYGDIAGWKTLDQSKNEKDIKDTLSDYVSHGEATKYMIKKTENNTDKIIYVINTLQDYLDYITQFDNKKVLKKELK